MSRSKTLAAEVRAFREFGKKTIERTMTADGNEVPVFVNEFWTARQRQANAIHEVSYRACFKPQLPAFFIDRLTKKGDVVLDPFMGRGTTLIESALRSRIPFGCDVNPLSSLLIRPRFYPPTADEVKARLDGIDLEKKVATKKDLLVFYHPKTLIALENLKRYFIEKSSGDAAPQRKATSETRAERSSSRKQNEPLPLFGGLDDGDWIGASRAEACKSATPVGLDHVDEWIRMVATNRLTGHSAGFFSVYTLPPNQAVSIESQQRINASRRQKPPERDVRKIILKKSRMLVKDLTREDLIALRKSGDAARLFTGPCDRMKRIKSGSVSLVVTSPPFLNEVNYRLDNWLRCWFNGIDASAVETFQTNSEKKWQEYMRSVFCELHRVLAPGGWIAFEVGEVKSGKVKLEELVIPAAAAAGLEPVMLLINDQEFTKTSKCWGVDNLQKGTNTNRIVLLRR